MESTLISFFSDILNTSGPYGLVAILCWVIWRVNEKKDKDLRVLTQKVITMAEAQTAAIVKIETAIVSLKVTIQRQRETNLRKREAYRKKGA